MNTRAFLKKHVQIPRTLVTNIKRVSELSCKKRWEYAGKIDLDGGNMIFATSRDRSRVQVKAVNLVWPSLVSFHTHPSVTKPDRDAHKVFVTLPSRSDFRAFIENYPNMQVNIICDAHGYTLIDVLDAFEKNTCPFPDGVEGAMTEFRGRRDVKKLALSEDNLEYFLTEMGTWKELINEDLNPILRDRFGVTMRYFTWDDEPPIVRIDIDTAPFKDKSRS